MRPIIRLIVPSLALLACTGVGAAQTTPLLSAEPPAAAWAGDAGGAGGAMDGALRHPVDLCSERWHTDLLLGLPTGLRCQAILGDDSRDAWVAEAFAGL